jgi:phosphoglycolate phosphatase
VGEGARYRLAIFDFDGTLADSAAWFTGVMNDAAGRFGYRRVDAHELETLRGMNARDIVRRVGLSPWKMPFLVRHMRARMTAEIHHIGLFPGVAEMLRRLREGGVAAAVVTSNSEPNVRRVLGPDLSAMVQHFGCGASLFGKRPHLRRALRRAGVAPYEALAVGDEIRDHQAAEAEGIPFGAVTWGYTSADALRALRPAETFDRVEAIADLLAPGTAVPLRSA